MSRPGGRAPPGALPEQGGGQCGRSVTSKARVAGDQFREVTGKNGGESRVTQRLKSQRKDLGFHRSDVDGQELGTWPSVQSSGATPGNTWITHWADARSIIVESFQVPPWKTKSKTKTPWETCTIKLSRYPQGPQNIRG